MSLLRNEALLATALITALVAISVEHTLLGLSQGLSLLVSGVLVGAIILASLRIAHHAERLAERVGEPVGTMILTLSAVMIEVVILAIMMGHSQSPTLARDTIYSAVMLDINGILGLAALLGGLRHGTQEYNVSSGNTYLVMILTAMGVSMGVPGVLPAAHWQVYSVFTIGTMLLLYGLFLKLQTGKHSDFFSYSYAHQPRSHADSDDDGRSPRVGMSIALLAVGIVIVGVLAEVMGKTLDRGLAGSGIPAIVPAMLVALISASPEILTSLRAALANRMQPVVNIALGASLSTVILTVPVIELLALIQGAPIQMAFTPTQATLTLLTLVAASINLHDGNTNAIEGMTHFVLFATFIMLAALGM